MSNQNCLSVNCDLSDKEFKDAENFLKDNGKLQEFFKTADALTKQWITKAACYEKAHAYFTAMMYYGMAIWHQSFTGKDPEIVKKSVEHYKERMQSCRNLLEAQWKEQQAELAGGNEPVTQWTVTSKEDLLDKITRLPQSFETLSGAENSKQIMMTKFIYPNLYPDLYYSENNNVLLYGPPGTGKTMLAQACVHEFEKLGAGLEVHFFALTASSARSKWEGGTEKNIEALFDQANALAEKTIKNSNGSKPSKSILFIDEVESLAGDRSGPNGGDRALTTLLQLMDGFKAYPNVIVLAATNRPWDLDPAFLRRFSASVFIDLEDFQGRQELIENSFFLRFQKTGPRIYNLKNRLCSLMVTETQTSSCDSTWRSYKALYDRSDVPYSEFFKDFPLDTYGKMIPYYTRFLREDEKNSTNGTLDLKKYMDRKVEAFQQKIAATVDGENCNQDCTINEDSTVRIRTAMILFHYLAEITGPSIEAVTANYVQDRKPSTLAKSSWGYSNSDLVKLVREIFSNTATRILQSRFDEGNCGSGCKSDMKCYNFNSSIGQNPIIVQKKGNLQKMAAPPSSGNSMTASQILSTRQKKTAKKNMANKQEITGKKRKLDEDSPFQADVAPFHPTVMETDDTTGKSYPELRSEINSDFIFSDSDMHDIYAVLTVDDFCNALRNPDIDTTTGNVNDYCSFLQYSKTKTYANLNESCGKITLEHYKNNKQNKFLGE